MNSRHAPRHIDAVVAAFRARRTTPLPPPSSATADLLAEGPRSLAGIAEVGALSHSRMVTTGPRRAVTEVLKRTGLLPRKEAAARLGYLLQIASQKAPDTRQDPHTSLPFDLGPDSPSGGLWEPHGDWASAAQERGVPGAFLVQSLGLVESPEGVRPRGRPIAGSSSDARQLPAITSGPETPRIGQVRGVLAERVVVSTLLDPFLTLKALVGYSGIGLRRLYDLLNDPDHPLPHYRVGGKILVRRSEFDAWITFYRHVGRIDVDKIAESVLSGLRS
jgi:hypothetical protein